MADLEFINISKSFGGISALRQANLSCNKGQVHALLGENGAGKSTLLKVLSGAIQANSGEIRIAGKTVNIRNPHDAAAHGVGTVYQELSIIPNLTVSENIFIGRIPRNKFGSFDKKKLRENTKELFEEYGVTDINPDDIAGPLSLSKRQMIEILRVLSKKPAIIIFDEATSALTENKVNWLLKLARKLADQGRIVIFISHRMSEIKDGCDIITILRNGQTVGEMKVNEVEMDKAISLMLGRKIEGYYPEIVSHRAAEKAMEVKNLSHRHILYDIRFDLYRGEVLGIGGLAGQGQAELLLSLFGILKSRNDISLYGKPYRIHSPKKSIENGIALIPEDRGFQGLLLPFSIKFNITLSSLSRLGAGPLLSGIKEQTVVTEYMNALQIKALSKDMAVVNLSGGNQQKVVLAKMLATGPKILMMHDVTRGVDVGTKKDIFTLVRALAAGGNSIIYFSTDVEELVNVCDRVLVMFDGTVTASFSESERNEANIVSASIGVKSGIHK
ncbi:MAG: sugar ABC transporter ATP-binding protein [Treponema sp.]|jgi:ABC-type sugar transport system ATPase subunit|nr:sugar ABC transporter ATP-binding protein [Treponema sp.]